VLSRELPGRHEGKCEEQRVVVVLLTDFAGGGMQNEFKPVLGVQVVPALVGIRTRIGQQRESNVGTQLNFQGLDCEPQVPEVPVRKAMKALLTPIMVKSLSGAIKLFLALNISNNIVIIRLLFKQNRNEGFLTRKRCPS
jgi:hypothetical protein